MIEVTDRYETVGTFSARSAAANTANCDDYRSNDDEQDGRRT